MRERLQRALESVPLARDGRSTAPDACTECGGPSLPGAGRCTDCLDA